MSFTIHNNHANDNIDNDNHNNTVDNNTIDNHLDNNEIYNNNNNNNNNIDNNNTQKKNITKPEIEPLSFTTCLCYGLIIFSTQILTLIFNTYYVEIYLNIHKLQPFYFYLGQFLYAIFNAINDPIFGFLSDYCIHYLQWKRSTLMLVSGPVLFLAFLGTVFSVTFESQFFIFLEFLCLLFLWDASFTFLILNHCALLPEITKNNVEKGKISATVSFCNVLSSIFLLPTFVFFFERENLFYFKMYNLGICILSFIIFLFSIYYLNLKLVKNYKIFKPKISFLQEFVTILKNLIKLKNFNIFVMINFLNIFIVSLFDSFKVRFIVKYIQPIVKYLNFNEKYLSSFYLTFITFISECFAVLNSLLVIKYSFYTLLNNIFKTRIFFSLFILFLILLNNFQFELTFIPFIFLFFILIIIGSVGRLLEISLANIVDEDMFIYFRKFKNSGNIFGINALLTKPAFSIAPSIGTFILNLNENYLFYLFVFTNLITATLQYLLWKYFDLHGTKLDYIQSELQKRQSSSSDNDDSEEEELDEDLRKEDENDHAPLLHH